MSDNELPDDYTPAKGCANMVLLVVGAIVAITLLFSLANTVAPLDELHEQMKIEQMEGIHR